MGCILQISDLHVRPKDVLCYGKVNSNNMLEKAISFINKIHIPIDAIVITGDVTDCGLVEEYQMLSNLLMNLTKAPYFLLPGNHDRRENLRAQFPHQPFAQDIAPFLQFDQTVAGIRLIGLDSVVPGHEYGAFDDVRLAWLQKRLDANSEIPTMIFMHHPPFDGAQRAGKNRLNLSGEALENLLLGYPNVVRVCAGHWHRNVQTKFAHGLGVVCPSTCHQVAFDVERSLGELMFTMEPPGLLLHMMDEEKVIYTHQLPIGNFDGPHPYPDEPDYPGSA
ncbi:MAG: phosphodiesterase [Alphaproteobacteria bacterium]